jgi:hypothetical protein
MAALLWPAMYPHFDDWGRMDGRIRRIKADIFWAFDNVTPTMIEEALAAFEAAGMIVRYESDNNPFVAVPHDAWRATQSHVKKNKWSDDGDSASDFPRPPCYVSFSESDSQDEAGICGKNRAESRTEKESAGKIAPRAGASPSPSPSLTPTPSPTTTAREDDVTGSLSDTAPVVVREGRVDLGVYVENILTEADRTSGREHWRQTLSDAMDQSPTQVRSPRAFAKTLLDRWISDPASAPPKHNPFAPGRSRAAPRQETEHQRAVRLDREDSERELAEMRATLGIKPPEHDRPLATATDRPIADKLSLGGRLP